MEDKYIDQTKEVVLTYFNSWQNKEWDVLRRCLANTFKIDGGKIQFRNIDEFIAFCQNGPSWSKVTLLDSIFQEKQAALLYEGETPTGEKIRVGEFLTLDQDKITSAKISISLC